MTSGPEQVCTVILAAGEGRRLHPLTTHRPKAMCPVGNVPLVDRALARVSALGFSSPRSVAVNACHLKDQLVAHLDGRVHLSVETGEPLGTSGGLARLRDWIDGRAALVGNVDAYLADPHREPGADIAALLSGWDGWTVRLLGLPGAAAGEPGTFSGHWFAGFSLLPWRWLRDLPVAHGDLVRSVWRPAEAAGELDVIPFAGTFVDTGTPRDYLRANVHVAVLSTGDRRHRPYDDSGPYDDSLLDPTATVTGVCHRAVIGAGAVVRGAVTRAVVWPGGVVAEGEHLVDAVRVGRDVTVSA